MTNADALALAPGDCIQLRPQPAGRTIPPGRTIYTVARVDFRPGYPAVRVISVEGFGFAASEVEKVERPADQ